ncbi:MAG TPA: hypothetical protein P5550_04060 [Bacteroidales bacterium]|nr:hypothetical protein [Bacteroidales bacterium]HRZ76475.1 hypothetical protein [Bacteroidales bacterium]
MKSSIYHLAFILLAGNLLSIDSYCQIQVPKSIELKPVILSTAPKYTTIDNILLLEFDMSFEEVVAKLGVAPNNFLVLSSDVGSIYEWMYKRHERKLPIFLDEKIQIEYFKNIENLTSGESKYVGEHKLYCIFDAQNKLKRMISDEGLKETNSIIELIQKYNNNQ